MSEPEVKTNQESGGPEPDILESIFGPSEGSEDKPEDLHPEYEGELPIEKPAPETPPAEKPAPEATVDDDDFDEGDAIKPWVDTFKARYGWDIPEDKQPKTIDGLLEFIEDVVDQNSTPKYASEESKMFDELVRNNGDTRMFIEARNARVDLSTLDLTNVENQKLVVKELLKSKGLSDKMIELSIDKSVKTDLLEEEANIAAGELDEYYASLQVQAAEEAKERAKTEQENLNMFVNNIKDSVNNIDQLFGFDLTKADKESLLPYVFNVLPNGKTQQQIDYEQDPVGYTILTSYAYMMRDKLLKKIEGNAKTKAVSNLQEQLKAMHRKRIKSDLGISEGPSDILEEMGIK